MSENRQLPMLFQPGELDEIHRVAKLMAMTECFKASEDAQKDVAIAAMKIIAGKEYGVAPFSALKNINIIKGKPGLSYQLMGAMIKRSGRYNYRTIKSDARVAEIQFFENGEPCGTSKFTLEDAQRAGLANSPTYRAYPDVMLFARCLSQGANKFCPDVFNGGVASVEELDVDVVEVLPGDAKPPAEAPKFASPKAVTATVVTEPTNTTVLQVDPSASPAPVAAPVTIEAAPDPKPAQAAESRQATESNTDSNATTPGTEVPVKKHVKDIF